MRTQFFVACAALLLTVQARADVIMGPSQRYTEVEEVGEIEIGATYKTPDGVPYDRTLGPAYGLTSHSVEWSPQDVPVMLLVMRDHQGSWIVLTSLLSDRQHRNACHETETISARTERSAERLQSFIGARFRAWMKACSVTRTLGQTWTTAEFDSVRRDFTAAVKRFVALRRSKYLPEERSFGQPSFLPTRVSQPLLNAITDVCGSPRERVQFRADSSVHFNMNPRLPYGPDGMRPVDSCVNDQLRYMPGYKTDY